MSNWMVFRGILGFLMLIGAVIFYFMYEVHGVDNAETSKTLANVIATIFWAYIILPSSKDLE